MKNLNDHLIDDMLSRFFKAELPQRWPALELPSAEARYDMPVPASLELSALERRVGAGQSRVSLAVSAALILGGFWYLSDRFDHHPGRPGVGLEGTNAKNPFALDNKPEKAKPKAEENSLMP